MNTTSYDQDKLTAAATPSGEHIPGPPHNGLLFLWIVWILAAAAMIVFGGMVFVGILQSVAA
jgi:hypothetical protein